MSRKTTTIFSKLLFYFITVMIIPLIILLSSYVYYSENNISRIITNQTAMALDNDINTLDQIIDSYKHIASEIAEDGEVKKALSSEAVPQSSLKEIYSVLFYGIGSDNTRAQASIISSSGKIQISTDIFPKNYDLRVYSNEWDPENILARALANEDSRPEDFYISISDHRTTGNGKMVFMTILRKVYSSSSDVIGYVIIDIFSDAIISEMNKSSLFQEEILVDNTSYLAISMLHPYQYGSFNTFPNLKNENLVTIEKKLPDSNFSIIVNTDIQPYKTSISRLMLFSAAALIIGLVFSIALSLLFSNSFAKRAKSLTNAMKEIEGGNLDQNIPQSTGIMEFDQLSSAFNQMTNQLISLISLTREEESKLAEAERKELENQLNPHFLFNTLNTIKALARLHGEDEIYTISIRLGKILRATLRDRTSECTLKESFDLVESYLMIQKIRFKDKLNYSLYLDDEIADEKTPKLIIQPLVENAIIHGLEPKTEAGKLSVIAKKRANMIYIEVSDDGVGSDEVDIKKLYEEGHVGLYNVYRRLELKYSDALLFSYNSRKDTGTSVKISFPLMKEI